VWFGPVESGQNPSGSVADLGLGGAKRAVAAVCTKHDTSPAFAVISGDMDLQFSSADRERFVAA
jgi:hypothetical protein